MKIPKIIVLWLLSLYRRHISPMKKYPTCRFIPTCSEYAFEAVSKYGVVKGVYLAIKRIARCHPFHPGGYDPLP